MIEARSPRLFAIFARIFERTLRGGFHAVRLANRPDAATLAAPNLVIYSNHPSWWDGVIFVHLAATLFDRRTVFTPIDAAVFSRYAFLRRIGGFAVEQGSARGALQFIECCRLVLSDPTQALLMTAQGRFADPRERPLRIEPGLAHLADLAPNATYLPLAIEMPFWLERRPEMLLRFGEPLRGGSLASAPADRLSQLDAALGQTMDGLAQDAGARDESAFETIVSGQSGINPFYDLWRRARALARGEDFRAGHGAPQ